MTQKKMVNPALSGPDQKLYAQAMTAYWQEWMQNPAKVMEHQIEYWGKSVKHYLEAQQALASGKLQAPEDPGPSDKRFKNPLWDSHPYFNFIKRQYLINSEALATAVDDIEDMDPEEKRRLNYFARQIVDMMAPTNFLQTNPDALEKALETEGESLVKGLENLVADLEANDGELVVRLADEGAFKIGENIATADGEVVYRNRMMELIQYAPTTDKVHETPIVLFPPWINKFYILDLKEKNSFIRWVVDQGYTLFVVSWVNPDESYKRCHPRRLRRGRVPHRDRAGEADHQAGADQRGRLLHRRHDAGADPVADEEARRQVAQVRHLLHRADRFQRTGRVHAVPAGRFHRRHRGRR